MNIYYTAKDIEEMAAKGIQQIELGPGVILTDFARETAQQFNIALVDSGKQALSPAPPTSPSSTSRAHNSKYNKPKGCQHPSGFLPTAPSSPTIQSANSTTVNKLIDLMGKVVKRGG